VIDDSDLERFLEPLITEWNRLKPDELRVLREAPIASGSLERVSYVSEDHTPFGYEYVEFEIRGDPKFAMRVRIEGRPADLSTKAYLPVVIVDGDVSACAAWLSARRAAN
jgi:hypothetical protein